MIKKKYLVLIVFLSITVILSVWCFVSYRQLFETVMLCEKQRLIERKQYFWEAQQETPDGEDDFFPVNRTLDYLRDTAVSFAEAHNLGDRVRELYQADEWTALKNKQQAHKRRKRIKNSVRRSQSKKFKGADLKRWTRQQIEHRFILPIDKKKFWLSSPFGYRKKPNGTRGFHYGIDMAAMHGTIVKAAGNGVVIQAGFKKGYGKVVVIKHDEKFKTRYAHFSAVTTTVGKKVKAGDVIGRVGSTGNARASGKTRDASHLHFEVEVYGRRMNPFYFFK